MTRTINTKLSLLKGGETMRTLGLVLALLFVVAGSSIADTVTYDVYGTAGGGDGLWQLITAPLVPFNPDPTSVFAGAPDGLNYNLIRQDPSSGMISYDEGDPGSFGNVLLGDGYYLHCYGDGTIQYTGVPDGVPDTTGKKTDMWISLPGDQGDGQDLGGWHIIGTPYNHNVPVNKGGAFTGNNISFTDGTTLKTWSEATAANWVSSLMFGTDPLNGDYAISYDKMRMVRN